MFEISATVILILALSCWGFSDTSSQRISRYAPDYQAQKYAFENKTPIFILTTADKNKDTKEQIPLEYTLRYAWRYQQTRKAPTYANFLGIRLHENGTITAFNNTGKEDDLQDRISQFASDLPDNFVWPEQNYKFQGPSSRIWTVDQLIEFIWLGGKNTSGIPIDVKEEGTSGEKLVPFISGCVIASLSGSTSLG